MNRTNTVAQNERYDGEEPRCASSGGVLLVVATDYVTWNRCLACGQSQVVGWVSCQLETLGAPAGAAAWGPAR